MTITTTTIKHFNGASERTTLSFDQFAFACGHIGRYEISGEAGLDALMAHAAAAEYGRCDACAAKARRRQRA